jgi:DNA-binding Xre family transcriptional regulator
MVGRSGRVRQADGNLRKSHLFIDIVAVLCLWFVPTQLPSENGDQELTASRQNLLTGYRSRATRGAAALSAGLFGLGVERMAMRNGDDPQSCIRAALRRRRRMLGLTQEATARLLGMSRLTYHRIESGARHIHFADLAAICGTLNCAPGELLQDSQLAAAFSRAASELLGQTSG